MKKEKADRIIEELNELSVKIANLAKLQLQYQRDSPAMKPLVDLHGRRRQV